MAKKFLKNAYLLNSKMASSIDLQLHLADANELQFHLLMAHVSVFHWF